jgi:hypothetical protein
LDGLLKAVRAAEKWASAQERAALRADIEAERRRIQAALRVRE